jgi:hypothetical protein
MTSAWGGDESDVEERSGTNAGCRAARAHRLAPSSFDDDVTDMSRLSVHGSACLDTLASLSDRTARGSVASLGRVRDTRRYSLVGSASVVPSSVVGNVLSRRSTHHRVTLGDSTNDLGAHSQPLQSRRPGAAFARLGRGRAFARRTQRAPPRFEHRRCNHNHAGPQEAPASRPRRLASFAGSTYSSRRPDTVNRYPRSPSCFHAVIRPA